MAAETIWFNKNLAFEDLHLTHGTMGAFLQMEWTSLGIDHVSMRMPVDERTMQPYGILHGGASCALAETLGSVASWLVLDTEKFYCVGLEINANHVRSAKQGYVTATARPLHMGKSTHVWDIRIADDDGRLVCVSRLTVAIMAYQKTPA